MERAARRWCWGTRGPLLPAAGPGRAGTWLVLSQRESMLGTGSVFQGNE